MELLMIPSCEGHLCPRCTPFQRAGGQFPSNAPPFRRPCTEACKLFR